jgi:hypothetical protein
VVQGETSILTLKLRTECGDPYDLSSFDKYKACFALDAGGALELTEVANGNGSIVELLGVAQEGKLKITINSVDTALLKDGAKQDIGLELDNATTPSPLRKNLKDILIVEQSLCG